MQYYLATVLPNSVPEILSWNKITFPWTSVWKVWPIRAIALTTATTWVRVRLLVIVWSLQLNFLDREYSHGFDFIVLIQLKSNQSIEVNIAFWFIGSSINWIQQLLWLYYVWIDAVFTKRFNHHAFSNLPNPVFDVHHTIHWGHWWRRLQPTSSIITDTKSVDANLVNFEN